jgi:hypothetical protein
VTVLEIIKLLVALVVPVVAQLVAVGVWAGKIRTELTRLDETTKTINGKLDKLIEHGWEHEARIAAMEAVDRDRRGRTQTTDVPMLSRGVAR